MKKFLLFLTAIVFSFGLKAQCPLNQAVDFTATDCHGTEVHLFDILDGGQYVLLDFFYTTCGPCQQATPKIAESYYSFGCNQHDVFYMEVTPYNDNTACQNWVNNYGIEYPTIGTNGGGASICNTYQIDAFPTVILIKPDHSIVIKDLWPINNANSVISALTPYGIGQYECGSEEPSVEITLGDVTPTTVSATFTPNADCASYWFMIGIESEMQMWQQMMSATIEQLVQMWGIQASGTQSYTWTDQLPGTEYTIYVVPADADGNTYDVVTQTVTTPTQGGSGEALVELTVELISNTSATINAVPNDETAEYHYGFITVDYYNEVGAEEAANIMREDGYPAYEAESFTWTNLEPLTYYYALGTAKNGNNEWGATTLVEIYTSMTGVAEISNIYSVYPNPANDFIKISGEKINTVSVFNTLGQIVDSFVTDGTEFILATSNYDNGIYFVKVNNGAAVRFVVAH